jgi:hypothetical protein
MGEMAKKINRRSRRKRNLYLWWGAGLEPTLEKLIVGVKQKHGTAKPPVSVSFPSL